MAALTKQQKNTLDLLDKFHSLVKRPFSDSRWTEAAKLFGLLSESLSTEERETLGSVWRDSFTGNSTNTLEKAVHYVKLSVKQRQ